MSKQLNLGLDMSRDNDGNHRVCADIDGLGDVAGCGETVLDACRDLRGILDANTRYLDIMGNLMGVLDKFISEEQERLVIRNEVSKLESLGVKKAWALSKSDIEDKILVLGIPADTTYEVQHLITEEMQRLFRLAFPDRERRPPCLIIQDDFSIGTKSKSEIDDMVHTLQSASDHCGNFPTKGDIVRHCDLRDIIRNKAHLLIVGEHNDVQVSDVVKIKMPKSGKNLEWLPDDVFHDMDAYISDDDWNELIIQNLEWFMIEVSFVDHDLGSFSVECRPTTDLPLEYDQNGLSVNFHFII